MFILQDLEVVWQRVRAAAVVCDSPEGRALLPGRDCSISVKKDSVVNGQARNGTATHRAAVSFHIVIEVICAPQTALAYGPTAMCDATLMHS